MISQSAVESRPLRATPPHFFTSRQNSASSAPDFSSTARLTLFAKSAPANLLFSHSCKRVRNPLNPLIFKSSHFHTYAHSSPGSPLVSAFYVFSTRGIYRRPGRIPKVSPEIRPPAATKLMPSSRYGPRPWPLPLPGNYRPLLRRNRISRVKINTAFAAPEPLGYGSGLTESVGTSLFIWPQRPRTI
jgi:hypothetical protein